MIVRLATPLRSYTATRGVVDAQGATLAELLHDLDRQFPGLRFRIIDEQDRIRPHIKLFVNQEQVHTLAAPLSIGDEIHVVCALSGG
jgi:molybdopterin converting factor small subunit